MPPLDYATRGGVKRRMEITDSTDDEVLDDIVADVNLDIEDMTGRQIGPGTVSGQLLDGFDAIEGGLCLEYPKGLRSVSSLEVASTTGGTFSAVDSGDIYLRPSEHLRQPDWPSFELWLTDIPSSGTALPVFMPGRDNIRLSADIGWAAIPSTITSAAEVTVMRTFLSNRGGHVDGSDELGERSFRALWRMWDVRTVKRYALKSIEIT
jgi:hypothetical protein